MAIFFVKTNLNSTINMHTTVHTYTNIHRSNEVYKIEIPLISAVDQQSKAKAERGAQASQPLVLVVVADFFIENVSNEQTHTITYKTIHLNEIKRFN